MSVYFPFVAVTHAESIFGGIPNFDEVIARCPPEFFENNPWSDVALHLYHHGLTKRQVSAWKFKSRVIVVMTAQLAYLRAWLKSLSTPLETKAAVCGWLLSLMLTECPHIS